MRKCLDRIGFGGYLSLAAEFPDFIDRAAEICDEFRAIYDCVSGGRRTRRSPSPLSTAGAKSAAG